MLMKTVSLSMIAVLISSTLAPSSSSAQSCDEVLDNCNKAYQLQKVLIKDQDDQLKNYLQKDQLQNKIIEDQKKQMDSPFHDPVKMIGLGIVGTLVVEIAMGVFRK